MTTQLNIEVLEAEYREAARKPELAEHFFYDRMWMLIQELKRLQLVEANGAKTDDADLFAIAPVDDDDRCVSCGNEMFTRHADGKSECTECGTVTKGGK